MMVFVLPIISREDVLDAAETIGCPHEREPGLPACEPCAMKAVLIRQAFRLYEAQADAIEQPATHESRLKAHEQALHMYVMADQARPADTQRPTPPCPDPPLACLPEDVPPLPQIVLSDHGIALVDVAPSELTAYSHGGEARGHIFSFRSSTGLPLDAAQKAILREISTGQRRWIP